MRALLIAVVVLLAAAAPVSANGVTVTASPNPVKRGTHTRVRGHIPPGNCRQVDVVSEAFPRTHVAGNEPALPVKLSKSGNFSKRVLIPATRSTGRYVVTMLCDGGAFGVIYALHVTA